MNKNVSKLKDFFKSNLGRGIHKNNCNRIVFAFDKITLQNCCGSYCLYIPFNLIHEVCSLYRSVGMKIVKRDRWFHEITVHFTLSPEIDLNYSFGQILIWSIRDDLDE